MNVNVKAAKTIRRFCSNIRQFLAENTLKFAENEPKKKSAKVLQKLTYYQSINYRGFCRFADLQTFSQKDYRELYPF